MLRIRKNGPVFLIVISLMFLNSCSLFSEGKPEHLTKQGAHLNLVIETGYNLNPNDQNEASPLHIRLYELQSANLFNKASFLDIYSQDSATLQDSLIKKHHIPALHPGQVTELNMTLSSSSTRYVGILAEFSHYQKADAKAIKSITGVNFHRGRLIIDKNNVFS